MDNASQSSQHYEEVRKLLRLAGLGDDVAIGRDQKSDQEVMDVICNVIQNFQPQEISDSSKSVRTNVAAAKPAPNSAAANCIVTSNRNFGPSGAAANSKIA